MSRAVIGRARQAETLGNESQANLTMDIFNPGVAIHRREQARYPAPPPFHPSERYPECPFADVTATAEPNDAYAAVRGCLQLLELDAERFGTPAWNPLGAAVCPGDRVVIKPNWVLHTHYSDKAYESVVTHGSIVRAVLDYVLKALDGRGSVLIADAPLWDADFDEIVRRTGMETVVAYARSHGADVRLMDLRRMTVVQENGLVRQRHYRPEQERASRIVDLAGASAFRHVDACMDRAAGSDYDRRPTRQHHTNGRHEYRVSQHVLDADVLISVAKLKTHKKAGVTLSMKNLVGINVDKNYLPHYRIGMPSDGGDEFPDRGGISQRVRQAVVRGGIEACLVRGERLTAPLLRQALARLPTPTRPSGHYADGYAVATHPGHNQKLIERFYTLALGSPLRAGNWCGNDTTWRMVVDLNTIALYADAGGRLHDQPARRYFAFIDGIVGGCGDGPMNPDPCQSGVVLAGFNPLSVDEAAVRIMGFDPRELRVLTGARERESRPLGPAAEPEIMTNWQPWQGGIDPQESLRYEPHPSWGVIRA